MSVRLMHVSLTADEEALFKGGRYYWEVTSTGTGSVLVRDEQAGVSATGRTIGQALDKLKAKT